MAITDTDPTTNQITRTFVGCVLGEFERNGRDDSDFFAVVWDAAALAVRTVEWGTTRFSCSSGCSVDATSEVRVLAADYQERVALEEIRRVSALRAAKPGQGKEVRVVKGRKVPVGTVGQVTGVYADEYKNASAGRYCTNSLGLKRTYHRVRVTTESGENFFTAVSNCEVIEPSRYLPAEETMAADARYYRDMTRFEESLGYGSLTEVFTDVADAPR